ncbi:RNA12 protein-domain-containing protein [Phellopilus nigrolimitatus]|nr:RNA12 protein-domain-containing protein [Phellopilus nigrolimitatus]
MLAAVRVSARRQPQLHTFFRTANCLRLRRSVTTASAEPPSPASEALLFVDSVFPVRFGAWDVRHYIGLFRQEHLLQSLEDILASVKVHGFQVVSLEPQNKDGGVFVRFKYDASSHDDALRDIVKELKAASDENQGLPSWTALKQASGDIWLVQGKPWREDLNRFASPMLKVSFEGPDIREESLYEIFRPFGRVIDLTPPAPGPAGALRSSVVTFRKVRAAATAHNCVHGITVPVAGASTRLHTMYERPLKAHAVRDWITGHPKLVVPVLVFFLGTITYTIFDPIRAFAVEGKMLDWFDYRKSTVYQWIKKNTVERLSIALTSGQDQAGASINANVWKERQDAETEVKAYLSDFPNTVTFVHGPQGSGKSRMLFSLLEDNERPVLTIDCAELYKANSDPALLTSLARQTGYWPVFPFINSLNNLIDIASVGLIGQKAGLSASLDTQVQQMLEVVGTGLKHASAHELQRVEHARSSADAAEERRTEEARRRAALNLGTWHDPRLDCVAGSGVICELGIGDELMRPEDHERGGVYASAGGELGEKNSADEGGSEKQKTPSEVHTLRALPIVVIKNFATKRGQDEVLGVLAKWAAALVTNQVAHVIVVSDNRENAKVLAQALPSKPLHAVALSDADSASALSFVVQKLRETGGDDGLTPEQRQSVERLGGRASDLETLVHKVRSGQRVEDAVEDIISRGVNELRKNAFGEDVEDAKSLAWTREQVWAVLKQLAGAEEISYHDVLLEFPFKGDEAALRSMEHAELITIGTHNGQPVYRYVFERLVADAVFRTTQEIASNTKRIAGAEATVRACEDELRTLSEIQGAVAAARAGSAWWGKKNAAAVRAAYVLKKMQVAESSLEKLEATNAELKKVLSKSR